jgi:DNA-binding NtrC family response regulator
MAGTSRAAPSLVLLVDTDPAARWQWAPLTASHGLEVVQSRSTTAALELLQRMPDRFRLVVVNLDMPGLPGSVLLETLRLFKPGIATLCLTGGASISVGAGNGNCLTKPLRIDELRGQLAEALDGTTSASAVAPIPLDVIARARACFAESGSLLEAARELALGMPGDPAV